VLDFLAGQLAAGIARRVAAGLHRGYREQAEQGPILHGRLDLPAQLRAAPGKEQLHGVRDDFTADVPCNQALRLTAERLAESSLIVEGVRNALRRSLVGLEGVQPVPPPHGWDRLLASRLPEEYLPLLGLCRLLLEGLAPGETAGGAPVPAFLLDMERVWEGHVTRTVREAFQGSGHTVSVQVTHTIGRDADGRPVVVRPDVTIDRDGRPLLVVDAKWKRPRGGAPAERDLYQVLSYCTTLGVGRAVLVYPGRHDRAAEWAFDHTPIRVTLCTLRAEGNRDACARSARRLGRALSGYTTPSNPPGGRAIQG
jgi:5-methylcytosine-specific restriction enzyme subunit McrC